MWEFIQEKKREMVYNYHMIIQPFWWAWGQLPSQTVEEFVPFTI